jgi:hypothetical protein
MEYASMNHMNKFDNNEPSEKMGKEISSNKEDFELYYEKDLGVNLKLN